MCMKPTELGQVHTKQEGIYAHADTHIAQLHTHTHTHHTQLYTLTMERFVQYRGAIGLPTDAEMFSSLSACITKKMMVSLYSILHIIKM